MRLELEELETRALLSASSATPTAVTPPPTPSSPEQVTPLLNVKPQQTTGTIPGYSPQTIQQAYGIDSLLANGTDGTGETIAIVDSSYDPNIVSDVAAFSKQFNLPQFGAGGPTFNVVTSNGTPITSSNGPALGEDANWAAETSLDVEWAHALAPGANILLVETPLDNNVNDPQLADLLKGVSYAANHANVVSMSWGTNETTSETTFDNVFKQNPNVTFVAASGDYSAFFGPIWPATSPYVLAVGGTTLRTTAGGGVGSSTFFGFGGGSLSGFARSGGAGRGGGLYTTTSSTTLAASQPVYKSETGWFGSGGGYAEFEGEPSFQTNALGVTNSRMTPDVAFDANPATGVPIYDSFQQLNPWIEVGGTSLGAPSWSAIVALADQQRGSSLGTYQVETTLYNALSTTNYTNVFHDITSGFNGYFASSGYDLVTGLGSPIANNLVPFLANTSIAPGLPTLTGTGIGQPTSTTFGFSSSSFGGFAAGGRAGGGLYVTAGSPTVAAGSEAASGLGANATNPPAATRSLGMPLSPLAPATIPSASTPVAGSPAGNASNNPLLAVSLASQTSPPGLVNIGNNLLAPSNEPVSLNATVFGASGWNGSRNAELLNSPDLHGPAFEQITDDQAIPLLDEVDNRPDTIPLLDEVDNRSDPVLSGGDVSSDHDAPVLDPEGLVADDAASEGDG